MHNLQLELKTVSEDGSFEGLAAVYGNKDLGGDIIQPGAFTKSLREKPQVPILWQHDQSEPIGIGDLEDTDAGLAIKGRLVLESDVALKAYALMKAGALKGLSIGYNIVDQAREKGARLLKELRLAEVSVVTFPMNPQALVSAVKEEPCAAKQLLPYA